jgi:hypothetical protein
MMGKLRTRFHDVQRKFVIEDEKVILTSQQHIPDSFLDDLAENRLLTANNAKLGDHVLAARIPAYIVDRWFREGFNIYQEDWPAIRARLVAEGMTKLLGTNRTL